MLHKQILELYGINSENPSIPNSLIDLLIRENKFGFSLSDFFPGIFGEGFALDILFGTKQGLKPDFYLLELQQGYDPILDRRIWNNQEHMDWFVETLNLYQKSKSLSQEDNSK